MWWTYPFKVNKSLAAMGIDPTKIDSDYRSNMQQSGEVSGLTPEETALIISSEYYGVSYPGIVEIAIGIWNKDKKIDTGKPKVSDALYRMGFNPDL